MINRPTIFIIKSILSVSSISPNIFLVNLGEQWLRFCKEKSSLSASGGMLHNSRWLNFVADQILYNKTILRMWRSLILFFISMSLAYSFAFCFYLFVFFFFQRPEFTIKIRFSLKSCYVFFSDFLLLLTSVFFCL